MIDGLWRRVFLSLVPAAVAVPSVAFGGPVAERATYSGFPSQEPSLVREMVGAAHGNVARVKELVASRPALARASWDWGYGDWETALGAASHVAHAEIAGILLANGAHPTIFSAAMLGQLDVVKAFVTASPGIQRTRGPHGITLLAHARNGKAQAVVTYLESLGGADPRYQDLTLAPQDEAAVIGVYSFGSGPTERLIVAKNARGALAIKRDGAPERNLFHQGTRVFNPPGAEAVRIRFTGETPAASAVTVEDGDVVVTARRV